MDIAIDVSQIVYRGTGVGRYVYGLTKALLELNSPHRFTFYAGVWQQKRELRRLSRTSPFHQAAWRLFPLPPKLANLIFNHTSLPIESLIGRHDLFHSSDWTEPKTAMPHVTTIHDLAFRRYPETIDSLVLAVQRARLERLVKNKAQLITDSQSTKQDLIDLYHLPASRITVVYPGIESVFKPQSKNEIERVKNKYKLPAQFILSVGTQEPRKNLARLIQAVESLDLPLILVGRHGWGTKTKTLGFVPEQDLLALYSAATVFAYPSLYEGFGFPVLEAMGCGTPVVTSNVSSLPEVAGQAGVLVDPNDIDAIAGGIKQALKNRPQLIAAGRKQAAKFSWEICAHQTLAIYEELYKLET